jgi:predicted RNA-binding protein with PUA-like domain
VAHWLYKSEPAAWSWAQQKDAGEKGTEWTGVRNYLARNNMRAMQIGDKGFFYHSNDGLEIVGIVEVCALSHPDSTANGDPRGTASISAPSATCRSR